MKQKIFKVVFILLGIMVNMNSKAQWTSTNQIVPPSPTASGLAKFAQFPISLYSGLVDINVSIYEVSVRDVSLPISLSYHPSGIRVNEESSWVGLGWSLNCGGVITSVVRGLSDINSNGTINSTSSTPARSAIPTYCGTSGSVPLWSNCTVCSASEPSDVADWEPDLFYFNFLGKAGTFIYNQGNTPAPLLIKDEMMSIVKTASGWTITTSDGYIYAFNQGENCTVGGTSTITNSWYLTQITSPLNEIITFTYGTTGTEYQNMYFDKDQINLSGSTCANTTLSGSSPTLSYATRYLSQINFTNGYINFIPSAARVDLPSGKSLGSIQIYRSDNTLVKQFDFTYGSFTSTISTTNYRASVAGSQDVTQRLQLQQIQEKNPGASLTRNPTIFGYNFSSTDVSKQLPSKTSFAMDYWGLYNGQTGNIRLLPAATGGTRSNPANRTSNATNAIACMLTTVTYPTKSITTYAYELNTNANCTAVPSGGGLRIKSITDDEGSGVNNIVKNYEYLNGSISSGKLLAGCPTYDRTVTRSYTCGGVGTNCNYIESLANTNFSVSRSGVGSPVGYDIVTIYQGTGGNGKTVNTYNNTLDVAAINNFPGSPTTASPLNGLLSNLTIYANNSGSYLKVKETAKTYSTKTSNSTYGMIKETLPVPTACDATDCAKKKFLNFYIMENDWVVPSTVVENDYKFNDQTYFTTVTTTYEFNNSTHKQLSRILKTNSDQWNSVVQFVYPKDYSSGTSWIDNLVTNYMHSVPVEKVVYNESINGSVTTRNVLSGEMNTYNATGKGLKAETWMLESATPLQMSPTPTTFNLSNSTGPYLKDSHYNRKIVYNTYDANNNLVKITKGSGATSTTSDICSSFIYGYGASGALGILPTAMVVNAANNSIAYTSFEKNFAEGSWSYSPNNTASDSKTGFQSSYGLTATFNNIPNLGKRYRVTLWVKNLSGSTQTVVMNSGTAITINIPTGNSWQLVDQTFTTTATNFTVTVNAMLLDELRLLPADAQMTTYTYDPLVGPTSTTAANNVTNIVEYDGLSRKLYLRDQDKNIRKKFDYVDKQ